MKIKYLFCCQLVRLSPNSKSGDIPTFLCARPAGLVPAFDASDFQDKSVAVMGLVKFPKIAADLVSYNDGVGDCKGAECLVLDIKGPTDGLFLLPFFPHKAFSRKYFRITKSTSLQCR